MLYLLYSLLLGAALLASAPYWLFQMLRHGKYWKSFPERIGRVPPRLLLRSENRQPPTIWVHAVSVGEVLAVSRLVEELHRQFVSYRVVVSTTTDTGQALARQRFGEGNVFYFPIDFSFAIRPYLRALQPELVVIAETEFWPNFLRLARQSGASIAIVNARISDRSWKNYRRFRRALRHVLENVSLFLAQTPEDASRLRSIGASCERIAVSGNLKFDVPVPTTLPIVEELRHSLAAEQAHPVLVCGSTVEGEEPLVLKAFEHVLVKYPKAMMVLAPRHPERNADVARLIEQMGIRFRRRSQWHGEPLSGSVLLVDTMGELASLYALADLAFVGGSLVPRGGHNILEPAQHGVPIIVGNHTENFRDIIALFQSRDAVRVVGPAEFPLVLMDLLANEHERTAIGSRAAETVQSQTGATQRTLKHLAHLLGKKLTTSAAQGAGAE